MCQLGTLEELPAEYRQAMSDINARLIWPSRRAGELTPIAKAERRLLMPRKLGCYEEFPDP